VINIERFEDFEHFEGGKLREMEKRNLCGHKSGILKLACGTVIGSFDRVFCVEIVNCQDQKQKDKQEGNVELFSVD
jgi:hypothetical protein